MRAQYGSKSSAGQGRDDSAGHRETFAERPQSAAPGDDGRNAAGGSGSWARDADECARQLCATVRDLSGVAELQLSAAETLELLRIQIGTALLWAERLDEALARERAGGPEQPVKGPHWEFT